MGKQQSIAIAAILLLITRSSPALTTLPPIGEPRAPDAPTAYSYGEGCEDLTVLARLDPCLAHYAHGAATVATVAGGTLMPGGPEDRALAGLGRRAGSADLEVTARAECATEGAADCPTMVREVESRASPRSVLELIGLFLYFSRVRQ